MASGAQLKDQKVPDTRSAWGGSKGSGGPELGSLGQKSGRDFECHGAEERGVGPDRREARSGGDGPVLGDMGNRAENRL